MLECTWNDTEAEFALRRLQLSEKKPLQKPVVSKPRRKSRVVRDSAPSRLPSLGELSLRQTASAEL